MSRATTVAMSSAQGAGDSMRWRALPKLAKQGKEVGMGKPTHPIRKMQQDIHRHIERSDSSIEPLIARHVKPLLDALGRTHPAHTGERYCDDCLLIAAWRAKP